MSEDECRNRRIEFVVEVGRKIVAVCQVVGLRGKGFVLQLFHVVNTRYGRHLDRLEIVGTVSEWLGESGGLFIKKSGCELMLI